MADTSAPEQWTPRWDKTRQLDRDIGFAYEYAAVNLEIAADLIKWSFDHGEWVRQAGELDEKAEEVFRTLTDTVFRAFSSLVGNRRSWLRHQSERASALIDLDLAADRCDSFGSSSAHSAAVVIANQAWATFWRAADPDGWRRAGEGLSAEIEMDPEAIRPRVAEVCQAMLQLLAGSDWPDLRRVIVATEIEVSRAMRARQQRSRPSQGNGTPREPPPPAPTAGDRIRLEPDSRSVRLDGVLIGANVHEDFFALLHRLLAHGGKVSTPKLGKEDRLRQVKWSRVFKQVGDGHPRVRRLIKGKTGVGYSLQLPARP